MRHPVRPGHTQPTMSPQLEGDSFPPEDLEWAIRTLAALAGGRFIACTSHTRYTTWETAESEFTEAYVKLEVEIVPCPWCLGWHRMLAMGEAEKRMWADRLETFIR